MRDLPHIVLGGLNLDEAEAADVDPEHRNCPRSAVAGLVAATGGNPLALIEAAQGLDEWQIAGVRPLGSTLTVGAHLEAAFAVHLEQLSVEGRMAVALAAAEPSGERSLLLSAAADLGVGLPGFREAVEARLLEETDVDDCGAPPLVAFGRVATR